MLEVSHISKAYKKQKVLDDVSFTMNTGEIIGLIGSNGAGKTTLMKILTGLIIHFDGTFNFNSHQGNDSRKIGSVIEYPSFYSHLSGLDNLKYFASISGGIDEENIYDIVHLLDMEEYIEKKAKTYSLGMKQRLGIAQALLNSPELLILDEPTNGLDPKGVVETRNIISEVAKKKDVAVLISSHNLSEIEKICDRVLMLDNGKLIQEINVKSDAKEKKIILESSQIQAIYAYFSKKRTIQMLELKENTLQFIYSGDDLESLITELIQANLKSNIFMKRQPHWN
jgi:ABC-2 type transport system ATP-binding protein